jgi:hypothetical protein
MVTQFLRRRYRNRHDSDVSGVDTSGQTPDGSALTGGIETLEHYEETGTHSVRVDEARREQAQLSESTLGLEDAVLGGFTRKRRRKVDLVDSTRHALNDARLDVTVMVASFTSQSSPLP